MERRSSLKTRLVAEPIRRHRPDYWLLIIIASLLAIGLIILYAIGPALSIDGNVGSNYYVDRQLIAVLLSFIAFYIAANVPISMWRRAYKPLLLFAAGATLIALIMPANPQYPAHRWIRLGSFSFQSVELLKFAVLVWLAGFLVKRINRKEIKQLKATLLPLLVALIVIGLVVAGVQSDLGSMGVIVVMMAIMAYVAGMPFKRVLIIGCIIGLGVVLAVFISPYRRERLDTYLHPTTNCVSNGYQACQAVISVGSGGLIGLGLGRSVQAYGYLPEAANDSIFAIYAEKFGFVGSTILLALFLALFARLKRIVEHLPDDFSRLVVIGVLAWLSVQTLINIGAMIGLLPLKGITLPFISYGGTSVVFVMAAMGLVFQMSRYTLHENSSLKSEGKQYENSSNRRRLRGSYNPVAGGRS
ncbi:MAG TPA: putative peptidoglycan glycosyltransferase FtsW [Candidatus Binatia bacterium]|nr:putative peptidoglycan glycosyltransferase FtsW [Candidatus Binatia bacterium]